MNVKQFIKYLKKFDPKAMVVVDASEVGYYNVTGQTLNILFRTGLLEKIFVTNHG